MVKANLLIHYDKRCEQVFIPMDKDRYYMMNFYMKRYYNNDNVISEPYIYEDKADNLYVEFYDSQNKWLLYRNYELTEIVVKMTYTIKDYEHYSIEGDYIKQLIMTRDEKNVLVIEYDKGKAKKIKQIGDFQHNIKLGDNSPFLQNIII